MTRAEFIKRLHETLLREPAKIVFYQVSGRNTQEIAQNRTKSAQIRLSFDGEVWISAMTDNAEEWIATLRDIRSLHETNR